MEEELLKLILLEVREFKTDIRVLKEDMAEVKENVKVLQEDMTEVKQNMEEVKVRLKNVEELVEFNKETCECIMKVTTQQYNEFKEFARENNAEHKKYNSKILNYKVEEDNDKY